MAAGDYLKGTSGSVSVNSAALLTVTDWTLTEAPVTAERGPYIGNAVRQTISIAKNGTVQFNFEVAESVDSGIDAVVAALNTLANNVIGSFLQTGGLGVTMSNASITNFTTGSAASGTQTGSATLSGPYTLA